MSELDDFLKADKRRRRYVKDPKIIKFDGPKADDSVRILVANGNELTIISFQFTDLQCIAMVMEGMIDHQQRDIDRIKKALRAAGGSTD